MAKHYHGQELGWVDRGKTWVFVFCPTCAGDDRSEKQLRMLCIGCWLSEPTCDCGAKVELAPIAVDAASPMDEH